MTVLTLAMAKITREIPQEILDMAFEPLKYNSSIDREILDQVVTRLVLPEINCLTGKNTTIELRPEWLQGTVNTGVDVMNSIFTTDAAIYKIPSEAREYRNITHVIRVTSTGLVGGYDNVLNGQYSGVGNTVGNMAYATLQSRTFSNTMIPPSVELLPNNMLRMFPRINSNTWVAHVLLEFDEDFNNVPVEVRYNLAELIVVAVKMVIYSRLILKIDANQIINGSALGKLKEIVESYSSEAEKFATLCNVVKMNVELSGPSLEHLVRLAL